MTQERREFIERVGSAATADMTASGVLASLTIAQAILESGWGRSALAVKANALFGIKATSAWRGRVFNADTQECYDGVNLTTVNAAFRAYASWEDSIADHSAFLAANARYAAVVGERDYKQACRAIRAAGYATDPGYADKLMRVIEQYKLFEFDAGAIAPEGGNDMNVMQDFIPAGRRNRPGRANPMRYITIHNTGNASRGAGARNHASYIKGDAAANLPASWHYTVDEKDIYQHIPDNEDAFHAGDSGGPGNRQSIGIEICMNSDGDLLAATDKAAELTAHLCQKHNIPVDNVVQHNRWSGKNCPQLIRADKPYGWGAFIGKVRAFMGASLEASANAAPPPTTAAPPEEFKVGDVVQFTGGPVFVSSNTATAAHTRPASRCKVTQTNSGARNPYHLVSEDSKGVHGWVAAVNVKK
jgi:N-acetylmuramoyl-L-alanine amidase